MTALEYFRLFATEFSSMSDVVVGVWLTLVDSLLDDSYYTEEQWAMVQALYAAHLLAYKNRSSENSSGGFITSEREGDLSRSYKALSLQPGFLDSTTYGVQYEMIRKSAMGLSVFTRMG